MSTAGLTRPLAGLWITVMTADVATGLVNSDVDPLAFSAKLEHFAAYGDYEPNFRVSRRTGADLGL